MNLTKRIEKLESILIEKDEIKRLPDEALDEKIRQVADKLFAEGEISGEAYYDTLAILASKEGRAEDRTYRLLSALRQNDIERPANAG